MTRGARTACCAVLGGVVLILACTEASASGLIPRIQIEMMSIQDSLDRYRADRGAYPMTDSQSTWIEKLAAGGYLDASRFGSRIMDEQVQAVAWGAYVYTPPEDLGASVVDPAKRPLVHWTGKNGIDDGRTGDDVTLFRSVNSGYYWKKRWPWIPPLVAAFAVGYAILLIVLRRAQKLDATRIVTVSVGVATLAFILIQPLTYTPFRILATTANPGAPGWSFAWVALFAMGAIEFGRFRPARRRAQLGRCPTCAYDLRGLDSPRCPECGTERA